MSGQTIRIEGLGKMEEALRLKAAELHAAAVEAVAQEVELTAADAQQGAPVKTGKLRASITRKVGELAGEVRATARYSQFVEHGTYKDPAQPFMQPAAEKARLRIPKTVAAIVGKALGGK